MLPEAKLLDQTQDDQVVAPSNAVSFAELLEQYEPEPVRQGQYVMGEILQINGNVILADVDAKRTAVVPPQDLAGIAEDELNKFAVGDKISLYILRTPVGDQDLLVSLSKGLEYQDWQNAKTYQEQEELHEFEVVGHNKGGLIVAFGHLQGFVPSSHVPQLQNVYNPRQLASLKAKLVGQELPLQVIEVDHQNHRLVLSAKKAQAEHRRQRLLALKLKEGETMKGQITNLVKFGAFVDLDGVEGLIHISEIAWQRVDRPADFLTVGDDVEVLIQSVDIDQERVSLSRKALLPSPWDLFDQAHAAGDLIEGVVTNVRDFGAFILVADGIEGLLHVQEMHGAQNAAPQDVLMLGDTVLVRILRIEPERQRLGLSQRRVSQHEEMEWIWQREQAAQQPPDDVLPDDVLETDELSSVVM